MAESPASATRPHRPARESTSSDQSSDEQAAPVAKKTRGKGRVAGSTSTVADAIALNIDSHCEAIGINLPTEVVSLDETQGQIRTVDINHVRKLVASLEANPPRDLLVITAWDATGNGVPRP